MMKVFVATLKSMLPEDDEAVFKQYLLMAKKVDKSTSRGVALRNGNGEISTRALHEVGSLEKNQLW